MNTPEFKTAEEAIRVLETSPLREDRAIGYLARWYLEDEYYLDNVKEEEPTEEPERKGFWSWLGL